MSSWNGEIELIQRNIIAASEGISVKTGSHGKDVYAVMKKTKEKKKQNPKS